MISIIKSTRGADKLVVDGFIYHLEKRQDTIWRWCCELKKQQCKGRISTEFIDGKHHIKNGPTEHVHEPIAYKKDVCLANTLVKDMAVNHKEMRPSQIIRQSVVECNSDSRIHLPSKVAQIKKISRQRMGQLAEPTTVDEINIPNELKILEGELFVLAEIKQDGHTIIILGTKTSLQLLAKSTCWIVDGTFNVVPTLMYQLFTVHGRIDNTTAPMIYGIMSGKSKACYSLFFGELVKIGENFGLNLQPEFIISDFERAIVLAAIDHFDMATYKGCFFHFGKNIWRQVQKKGFASLYGTSVSFSNQIRAIKSLAFLKPDDVIPAFEELYVTLCDEAKNIADWFGVFYVYGKCKSEPSPMYKPKFGTIHEMVEHGLPRTQNSVESWHNRLNCIIGKAHIGLYQLIKELQHETIVAVTSLQSAAAGYHKNLKVQYIKKEEMITNLMLRYDTIPKLDFLHGIAIALAMLQ